MPKAKSLSHIAPALRSLAVPVDSLAIDPANAKIHGEKNLDAIKGSLAAFGQKKPIVVRRATMIVCAGNGTLAAARALGWTHIAANVEDMDAATAAAYSIADNRTAELAEWDPKALDALLSGLPPGLNDQIDAMLADLKAAECPAAQEVVEDEVPPVPADAITKPGDLWLLGDHRLLCGDSTKAADVARVMAGERAGLCFTSPPYAQQRDYGAKITDWDGLMRGVFGNLPMADDGQVLVNLGLVHRDGEWWPYWDGWIEWMRWQGWRRFGWYVWDKGQAGRAEGGRLPTEHEPVFHFCKNPIEPCKAEPCKSAGRTTTVPAKYSGPEGQHRNRDKESTTGAFKPHGSVCHVFRNPGVDIDHPAPFPVAFATYWIECWPGLSYEPFAGSGTTIIAAEQLARRCFAIEIEPRYVDVCVARWEKLTGKKATLEKKAKAA